MKHLLYFLLLLAISLFFQGYRDILSIADIHPDLLLLLVIYFSLKEGVLPGIWFGFGAGILQDALTVLPLGWQAMPKALVAYIVGRFGYSFKGESLFSLAIFIFVISLIKGFIAYLLALIFINIQLSVSYKVILPESLYNAILGPMLFTIFDKIFSESITSNKE